MFKIINYFSESSLKNVITFANDRSNLHNTRGHRFKLVKLTSHKNCCKYCFSNRIFDAWNFLPDTCFNTNLTASFKNKLDKINFNAFISHRP